MRYNAAEVRKFLVAAAGFVVTVLVTVLAVGPELIPAAALPYINIVIAVAASYGVFAVRNAPARTTRAGGSDDYFRSDAGHIDTWVGVVVIVVVVLILLAVVGVI